MDEAEAISFLRGLTTLDDYARQVELHRRAVAAVAQMPRGGIEARVAEIDGFPEKLLEVKADARMKEVVVGREWSFKLVEADKLVCLQKYVNVDYAKETSLALDLNSLGSTLDLFLTGRYLSRHSAITSETSVNLYAIHADGSDLRVFDSREEEAADGSRSVVFRVGWGPPQTQVVHLNDRYILKNGYHRVYAARSQGVEMIPCVLIEGRDYSDLENPGQPQYFGREQALSERPALFSDLFVEQVSPLVRMNAVGRVIVLQPELHELSIEKARDYLSALPPSRSPMSLDVTMKTQFAEVSIGKEDWNQYFLEDGTVLFMRQIAKRARAMLTRDGTWAYQPELEEPIAATICPESALGAPSRERYSSEQLSSSVLIHHVGFKRIAEPTNEYVLRNNDKITLTLTLLNVAKTDKFNDAGEPIYLYETEPILGFIRSGT